MKTERELRCFAAVNLPADLRGEIAAGLAPLKEELRGVKWVSPANLHLTVKFFGSLAVDDVAKVGAALETGLAEVREIPLFFKGAGVFPPRGRPRVLWIGVAAGGDDVLSLKRAADEALRPLGYPPDDRPFRPHLTVGRVRDFRKARSLPARIASLEGREWGGMTADRVQLMQSDLFPTGPRYSILQSVPLVSSGHSPTGRRGTEIEQPWRKNTSYE